MENNKNIDVETLEKITQEWKATIDAIIDPLMIIDKNYNIQKINKAMASHANAPIKSLLGTKCHKTFAGSEKPCEGCKLQEFWGNKSHGVFWLESGDQVYEVSSQPVRNKDESLRSFVHIYRDRSRERLIQKQLVELSYKVLT